MPVDFPDMRSLKQRAQMWGFREPEENEEEQDYRKALAKFVVGKDKIEAFEILFGKGWDKWNDEQKRKAMFGSID